MVESRRGFTNTAVSKVVCVCVGVTKKTLENEKRAILEFL